MTTRRHPVSDPGVRRWGRALPWLLIGLGLGAHFLAFRAFVLREVAWGYPRLWDQAGVLAATYTVHHVLREHGLVGGLGLASMWTPPQGVLLHLEAALLMRVVGPSRLAALAILWLHLAAFLVLLAGTLRRLARGAWWPAMLGLGLMLAVASLRGFGGLADFRFDLSATCAYGAFLCLALRARALAQPRGAALAGLMAGYLVALRHIAGVYVLLTLTALALLELRRAWRGPRADRQAARQRLRGVAWCLGALALCAGPLLAWRLPSLRAYYWWGHVEAGAAHAALAGVRDATAAWLYYPGSLLSDHAGPTFGALALASLVIPGLAWRHATSRQASIPHDADDDLSAGRRLLLCALLMPLATLSADTAKSPIVAGVVMPAVVLLSCLPALRLARATMRRSWHVAAYALGTSVLLTGLGFQFAWLRGPGPLQPRAESAAITDLYLTAARLCLERGQVNPVMFVDDASEYHVPTILTTLAYERYGRLIIARTPVGFPPQKRVDPVALRTTLGDADLALLSRGTAGPLFPYSQSLARYRADIDSVVARQLAPVTRAVLASGPLELWAQPHPRLLLPVVPPVPGWAWIERQQGLVIEIPSRALRARPALLVQGRGRLDLLGGDFGDVRATLRLPDGRAWNVAASARVYGERYTLRAELASGDLARLENTPARGQVVQIRFDFARGFRPSERGLGADSRELVTANPTHIELVRGSAAASAEDATAPWPDLQPSAGLGVCAPGAVTHTARAARRRSGDLDGDGHPDLLWQDDRGRLLAWSLRARRCLALRGERALSTWQRPVGALDVDGDGRAELLFQDRDTGQLEQSALEGSQGLRSGEPTALGGLPVPADWQAVGLGDVDGDGRSDVVGIDATGTLRALSIVGTRLEQGPRLDPPSQPRLATGVRVRSRWRWTRGPVVRQRGVGTSRGLADGRRRAATRGPVGWPGPATRGLPRGGGLECVRSGERHAGAAAHTRARACPGAVAPGRPRAVHRGHAPAADERRSLAPDRAALNGTPSGKDLRRERARANSGPPAGRAAHEGTVDIALSIVVPAYNERASIGATLDDLCAFLGSYPGGYEIIVVADGDDGTREWLAERAAHDARLTVLGQAGRGGKGRGVRLGIAKARGSLIGFVDADGKTPSAELARLLPFFEQGYDIVIGSRGVTGACIERAQPLHRRLGSRVFALFMHLVVGLHGLRDTQCGFKFFRGPVARELFARQRIDGYMFDVEVLHLAERAGWRIKEVGVRWRDDGDSRLDLLGGNWRNFLDVLSIRFGRRSGP